MPENAGTPRNQGQKFVTLFEAAKRSLLAAEELHKRLAADLLSLEPDLQAGNDVGDRAIAPLISAICFVDFAHRFGSLVDALPKINKRSLALRRLREALASVEQARHHLQHLRRDLSEDAQITYAILGELNWTHDESGYMITLTEPHQVEHFSIAYNIVDRVWTAKHRYTVKGARVDIDPITHVMREALEWIGTKVKFSDEKFARLEWGATQGLSFRVSFPEDAERNHTT